MSQIDISILLDSPESMELNGIFIAQEGRYGRNHYICKEPYPTDCKKSYLELFGSVISNKRTGTKWTSGGAWVSGYEKRERIFDPNQTTNPPPFLPNTTTEFYTQDWEEVE